MPHQFPGSFTVTRRIIPFLIVFFYSYSSAMEEALVPSAIIAGYVAEQQKKIAKLPQFSEEKERECRNLWYSVDALRLPAQQFAQEFKTSMLSCKGTKPLACESYYQILGLDPEKAKTMPHADFMRHIASLRKSEKKVTVLTQLERRQAMEPFHTPFGKNCYDAYLSDQLLSFLTTFKGQIITRYSQSK